MKEIDKIINAVTCNGMRELEEERCRQIAEEYALAKVNQARREERERHAGMIKFTRCMSGEQDLFIQPRAKQLLAAAGYGKEEK